MKSSFVILSLITLLCLQASFAGVTKKKFSLDEGGPAKADTATLVQEVPKTHTWCSKAGFANLQKELRENVTQKINAMKNGEGNVVGSFLLICLLYGMLHALGPGHGKSIVVGYFLARRGRWRQGVALGASITFAHTLSAVLLLFVLYAILKAAVFPSFELGRIGMEKTSYVLVMITGAMLVAIAVRDAVRKHDSHDDKEFSKNASWREIVGVAAVTGIVPCPAVALIVLFCLLNSMVALALVAAGTICVGMTATNIAFGVAAIAMRKGIDKGAGKTGRLANYIHIGTTLFGGILVFVAGLVMLSTSVA